VSAGDFLPEWKAIPIGSGLYRPAFRLFEGRPLRFVPGSIADTCPIRTMKAAKEYVGRKLNPPIRAATAPEDADPLGIASWLENRDGEAARRQEQAFGTVFRKGRAIPVEKRKRLA
jgi:hypothetical protein